MTGRERWLFEGELIGKNSQGPEVNGTIITFFFDDLGSKI